MSVESARAGDERAFGELIKPVECELRLHRYRMLGSLQDAEDLLQETLPAAWRGLSGFEERASLRAWLYRIATNRYLNALRERVCRPAVVELPGAPSPTGYIEPLWLDPYPDDALPDPAPGPEAPVLGFRTARVIVVSLTTEGRRRYRQLDRLMHEVQDDVFGALTPGERQNLESLRRLSD